MSEYRQESQTLLLLNYLRKHPGLVLSISYFLLTLCGILYSATFYEHFDIAILKLANVTDLLIAGISEPAALIMFCGGILMAVSFDYISQRTYKLQEKWREKPKSIKRFFMMMLVYTPKRSESVMIMTLGMFVLYAYFFVSMYAEWQSEQIKQGNGDQIMVLSDVLGKEPKQLMLLGSTTNFLLTYSRSQKEIALLPIENIQKLTEVSSSDKADTE